MLAESRYQSVQLRKSEACHRCRRRKMRCDAQRPVCGACVKSHRYTKSRSRNPGLFAPLVECTYDDSETAVEANVDNIIASLEAKIQGQDADIARLLARASLVKADFNLPSPAVLLPEGARDSVRLPSHAVTARRFSPFFLNDSSTPKMVDGTLHSDLLEEEVISLLDENQLSSSSSNLAIDTYFFNWPSRLPPPDLLHHLVDVFFRCYPFANHMLHQRTFETALSLPPSSPYFPKPVLLYAICATASFHSHLVQPPTLRSYEWNSAGDVHTDFQQDVESFGEVQAFYADAAWMKHLNTDGEGHLEVLIGRQSDLSDRIMDAETCRIMTLARILLAAFHHANARYDRTWGYAGIAMQLASTYQLHLEPTLRVSPLSYREKLPTLTLPTLKTFAETAYRRNCFWMAYFYERLSFPRFGWNRFLSDAEINQSMPISLKSMIHMHSFPTTNQRFDTPDLFTSHLEESDGFVLLTKATYLVSQVHHFNMRYRLRREDDRPDAVRSDPSFQELETLAVSFVATIPAAIRDPLKTGSLDVPLLTALNIPYLALILLHSPQADYTNIACPSVLQIQFCVYRIIELLHPIINSNCDLSLADSLCSAVWANAGLEHIEIAVAYAKAGLLLQARNMRAEVDVFVTALTKLSERLPISYRHFRLVVDNVVTNLDPLLGSDA